MASDQRTYIKLHDGMPDHPKVAALSDKAFRTLVETWCWCSRNLTDGQVPTAVWRKKATPKVRAELVAAGLVEEDGNDVGLHDYLQHQRSAAEVADLKAKRAAAGRRGGRASKSQASASASAEQASSKTQPETEGVLRTPQTETEGEAPARSADPASPPPARCAEHGHDAVAPPCWACRDARQTRAEWERARRDRPTPTATAPPCHEHPEYPSTRCPECARRVVPSPGLRLLRGAS